MPTGNAGAGSGPLAPPVRRPAVDGPRDSGSLAMRWLNRIEYDNAARDLLGTSQQLGRGFSTTRPSLVSTTTPISEP